MVFLFRLIGVLGLLAALVGGGMGVRSYWKTDWVGYEGAASRTGVGFYRGRLIVIRDLYNATFRGMNSGWMTNSSDPNEIPMAVVFPDISPGALVDVSALGFVLQIRQGGQQQTAAGLTLWNSTRRAAVPVWAIVLVGGAVGWVSHIAAGRRLRGRRRANGLCVQCGYDVRASPDACPECGRPVSEVLTRA